MVTGGSAGLDWAAVNEELSVAGAEATIRWTLERYGRRAALTCSFGGASGMALLDLALRIRRDIPVLVIDTGLLFDESYALIDAIERHYGIEVRRVRPALSLEEQAAAHGPELYARDPDRCCGLRKVAPLAEALKPYAAWLTAVRRDQSAFRAATRVIQWNERHQLVKVCPLAHWSEREVWRYLQAHGVPYNPLLDQGYPSLGCVTCTARPVSEDPRSGRWSGFSKTECGLHL